LDTKIFLGALWHWIKKGKEDKRREGASKEEKDQETTKVFLVGINLHVYFPLLDLACMVFHVVILLLWHQFF